MLSFTKYLIEKTKNGNQQGKKFVQEGLVSFVLNSNTTPSYEEMLKECKKNNAEEWFTESYYKSALMQAKLIKKEVGKSLIWNVEGQREAKIIESIIKHTGLKKDDFHPADIWGISEQGLKNIAKFDSFIRTTPSSMRRRLVAMFFMENLKSKDIIGVSLKYDRKLTYKLKKFIIDGPNNPLFPPKEGFTLATPIKFKVRELSNKNIKNKVAGSLDFHVKEKSYHFYPLIMLSAEGVSLVLKGGGGTGGVQSAYTRLIFKHLNYINQTKVPLYANKRDNPPIQGVPLTPSKKLWDTVRKRLQKSANFFEKNSISPWEVEYEMFRLNGEMQWEALRRAIIICSWAAMIMENWERFSIISYTLSLNINDNFPPYWKVE